MFCASSLHPLIIQFETGQFHLYDNQCILIVPFQFPLIQDFGQALKTNRGGYCYHICKYLNSFANLSFVSKYLDVRLSGIKNIECINLKIPYIPKSKNKLVPTFRMSFSSPKNVKL